jgi:large subunit ribosomal protein L21
MEAYAVIDTGGKQYLVKARDVLKIEKLEAKEGDAVTLTPVLAVSDGTTLKIGTPHVKGASVKATLVKHMRGEKVFSFKKKRRKGYKRKVGHRQSLSVIKIESV